MQSRLLDRRRLRLGAAGAALPLAALAVLLAAAPAASEAGAAERAVVAQAESTDDEAEPAAPEEPPSAAEEPPPSSDEVPSDVEVLTVRGRATSAIETDVPSSLTQFDASTIEALGAQDISDLSRVTPNVNIVQPGSTQATFFVRGVGLSDFSSNAAGAVTIFQDDVAINAPAIQTPQLFDVDSVDVVRGPQGTGPFRNASAGAIRVKSKRPTGNFSAQLRSSIGRYDTIGDKGAENALIQDYEGALEMPIVQDSLSSRFAFRLRDADPYRTNRCGDAIPFSERLPRPKQKEVQQGVRLDSRDICGERGAFFWPNNEISRIPVGLPREVNDEHDWAARGTLGLLPPDTEVKLFLNAHGSRLDEDSTLGQAIGTVPLPGVGVPFGGQTASGGALGVQYVDADVVEEISALCGPSNAQGIFACPNVPSEGLSVAKQLTEGRPLDLRPYAGDYNRVGRTTRDSWGGFLSGEFPVWDDTKLSALASYDGYDRFTDQDTDFTPDRFFEVVQADEAWQMYHELKLEGELAAEPIQWNVGGYYLGQELDTDNTTFLFSGGEVELQRVFGETIDSFGLWGGFGWDFADDFTLEGGVRWNWERKEFEFRRIERRASGTNPDGSTMFSVIFDDSAKQDETWSTPTGELILRYHLNEYASAYAKYARGFKAGHFNSLATQNLEEPPADEEYNDSWEVGLRGSWWDRRIDLAGAFFYYRYENYQVFLFQDSADAASPPVLTILNAKQAENYGIELEGTLLPLRGWAWQFLEGLRLSGTFGWLHGEYIDFVTTQRFLLPNNPRPVPVAVDFSGNRLQNAPEYKVSATVEWTFDLGRFGYLVPRYDVNWSDDVFFDPNEGRGSVEASGAPRLPEYAIGQKAYFLHNVRLAYRTPSGNIEVAGWMRNVDDQVYKNFAFDASRFTGIVINFPGEPRSYGMDLTFTF